MPRRPRLLWLDVATQQYDSLPADVRDLVDERLETLLADPTPPESVYGERFDQHSVAIGAHGLLLYAVVAEPPNLIVLRLAFPFV